MRRRRRDPVVVIRDVAAWARSPAVLWGVAGVALVAYLVLLGQMMAASRRGVVVRRAPFPAPDPLLSIPVPKRTAPSPEDVSSLDMVPKLPEPASRPAPRPPPGPPAAPPADDDDGPRPDWAQPPAGPPPDAAPAAVPTRRTLVLRDLPSLKASRFSTSAFLPDPKPTEASAAAPASRPSAGAGKAKTHRPEPREFRDIDGKVIDR